MAVTEAVATKPSREVDEVREIRVTGRLASLANGCRLTPVLLLLDRAEKMLGSCGVHSGRMGFDTTLRNPSALRAVQKVEANANAGGANAWICTAVRGAETRHQLAPR